MKILLIEDDVKYQKFMSKILTQSFGSDVSVTPATNYIKARVLIQNTSYDLIVTDLDLPEGKEPHQRHHSEEFGRKLLEDIYHSKENTACPRIVLTAFGDASGTREALKNLGVSDFIAKAGFNEERFLRTVKTSLFDARMKKARALREQQYCLSLSFTDSHITGLELQGPDRYQTFLPSNPTPFDAEDLSKRTDRLNVFLTELHDDLWREEARSIGKALYEALEKDPGFHSGLAAARILPARKSTLLLRFRGPRASLSVPFELLYNGQEYLALDHPIYRQVLSGPTAPTEFRKVQPFHVFLQRLVERRQKLQVLLIASNVVDDLDAVDDEIAELGHYFRTHLPQAGIDTNVEVIQSSDATYERMENLLKECRFHIIHYAGHGEFKERIAEKSCLFFRSSEGSKPMSASTLKLLLQNSETYLFYLSCCLGARTAERTGQGDFLGLMDGIVQADIPAVIGFRWVVSDTGAKDSALAFYSALFSNLSVEDALFQARNTIAARLGRENETWASPVLVVQTPGSVYT